jgi:Fic family protein
MAASLDDAYLPWDEHRRRPPPEGLDARGSWLIKQLKRRSAQRVLPWVDRDGVPLRYALTDAVLARCQRVEREAAGRISSDSSVGEHRDRYLIASLMEEAISSSQLEGAATTRQVAKEMLRAGRAPRTVDERMIANNYATMRQLASDRERPLTPASVLAIHRSLTRGTLADPAYEGALRTTDDVRVVDDDGVVLHQPPAAAELPARLEALCAFANGDAPTQGFLPPVVRAIAVHYMLAYDHPFVDGNGRTARALFYGVMLREGYGLLEFVSISRLLRKATAAYARSFLYVETDEQDLTYFVLAQLDVLCRALDELRSWLDRKAREQRRASELIRGVPGLNHRQLALLEHATRHDGFVYTIEGHRHSHGVVYQTARSDLLDLAARGLLEQHRRGRAFVFLAAPGLVARFGIASR